MQALQDQQKYKANFVFACFPTKQGFKQPLQWQGAKIRNSTYSGTYSYLEIRTFPSIKINCVHFQEQKQFDCSISPLNLLIINQKRNLTKTQLQQTMLLLHFQWHPGEREKKTPEGSEVRKMQVCDPSLDKASIPHLGYSKVALKHKLFTPTNLNVTDSSCC